MTGFHGFHVFFGVCLLLICLLRFAFFFSGVEGYFLEGSVIYWHFVDVVWLFLFLVLYMSGFSLLKILLLGCREFVLAILVY